MAIAAPEDTGRKFRPPQKYFEGLEFVEPAVALQLATARYENRWRYRHKWGLTDPGPKPTPRIQAKLDAAAPLRVERRPVPIRVPTAVVKPVPRPRPPGVGVGKPSGGFQGEDPGANFFQPPVLKPKPPPAFPPIAKLPKLPPPPPRPSAPPASVPPGGASGGGGVVGVAGGGILLLIGAALLASLGKR